MVLGQGSRQVLGYHGPPLKGRRVQPEEESPGCSQHPHGVPGLPRLSLLLLLLFVACLGALPCPGVTLDQLTPETGLEEEQSDT